MMGLAVAWMPLTSHCLIEAVPGFEFLRCAADTHDSDDHGDPCEDGECCALESAVYQPSRPQDVAPHSLVAVLLNNPFVFQTPAPELPPPAFRLIDTAAPPEIPSSWQFSLRAALPIRAPSSPASV